jgi:hypothetical protein
MTSWPLGIGRVSLIESMPDNTAATTNPMHRLSHALRISSSARSGDLNTDEFLSGKFSAVRGFLLSQQGHDFATQFHCALQGAGGHTDDFFEKPGHPG